MKQTRHTISSTLYNSLIIDVFNNKITHMPLKSTGVESRVDQLDELKAKNRIYYTKKQIAEMKLEAKQNIVQVRRLASLAKRQETILKTLVEEIDGKERLLSGLFSLQ